MSELDPKLREQIEWMVFAAFDACYGPHYEPAHPGVDPHLEVAYRAATIAVEHERELVCENCGDTFDTEGCIRRADEDPRLEHGGEPITRAQFEHARRSAEKGTDR